MELLYKIIKNPYKILSWIITDRAIGRCISDRNYLSIKFHSAFGKPINWDKPRSFNEKLQWLKLNDRKAIYTRMVDKEEMKKYVSSMIGDNYVIPTIGVWDCFDDIDFYSLPDQFVLKCTHDSGGVVICTDKSTFDVKAARAKINRCLKNNFYWLGREWAYKGVKPRIIAEQYMENGDCGLDDYKVHCFNGKAKLILVCKDRFTDKGLTEDFYSTEWEFVKVMRPKHPNSEEKIEKPVQLEEMISLAEKISSSIPFLRVDFYIVNNALYIGELTFSPASGFEHFDPEEFDNQMGDWLKLPC